MMELSDAIKNRRTVRRFKQRKVDRKLLEKLIEMGMEAPSSCNQQRYSFVIVDDPRVKQRLKQEAGFRHALDNPAIIYVLCGKRYGRDKLAHVQGLSASVQNMLLYAQELGLGTWWMASCGTHKEIMKVLGIPDDFMILSAVGVGYPDENTVRPMRRKAADVTSYNHYTGKLKEASVDPDDWPSEALIEFATLAVFAKNPKIGYNYAFDGEFKSQISVIAPKLKGNVLMMHDISGVYSFALATARKDLKFTVLVYTRELKGWMEERRKHLGLENVSIATESKSRFETVCMLETANRLPQKELEKLLGKAKGMMAKDGMLVLSSINRMSIYGLAIRKGISRRFGPEKSLCRGSVKRLMTKRGLKIIDEYGFNLLPSFRIFLRIDVPNHLSAFRSLLRRMARMKWPEEFHTKGCLRRVCTSTVFFARQ